MASDPTPVAQPDAPTTSSTLIAEFLGTFLLVLGGVGAALFASDFGTGDNGSSLGIGFAGVALAFGLTVVVGVYAFGPISGGHFNPAVTLGAAAAGRIGWSKVPGYIVAQVIGGACGTGIIALIGSSNTEWLEAAKAGGFASNGFGEHSPGGFGIMGAIVVEIVFTAIFLFVILGVTHPKRGNPALAGLAIGLTLTLIHLVTIPVDNTSVNPARSIAAAIYGGGDAWSQVWVFIVFPIIGALLAGFLAGPLLHREND